MGGWGDCRENWREKLLLLFYFFFRLLLGVLLLPLLPLLLCFQRPESGNAGPAGNKAKLEKMQVVSCDAKQDRLFRELTLSCLNPPLCLPYWILEAVNATRPARFTGSAVATNYTVMECGENAFLLTMTREGKATWRVGFEWEGKGWKVEWSEDSGGWGAERVAERAAGNAEVQRWWEREERGKGDFRDLNLVDLTDLAKMGKNALFGDWGWGWG